MFYTGDMENFFDKYRRIIAVYVLYLMIGGMFCIGMFMPPVEARSAGEARFKHSCQVVAHQTELNNRLADCCLERPYRHQAIINDKQRIIGAWCSVAVPTADFQVRRGQMAPQVLEIWPPPNISLLRSVMKKE